MTETSNSSVHDSNILSFQIEVARSDFYALDQQIRYLLRSWVLGHKPPTWVWDRIESCLMGKGKLNLDDRCISR